MILHPALSVIAHLPCPHVVDYALYNEGETSFASSSFKTPSSETIVVSKIPSAVCNRHAITCEA